MTRQTLKNAVTLLMIVAAAFNGEKAEAQCPAIEAARPASTLRSGSRRPTAATSWCRSQGGGACCTAAASRLSTRRAIG